MKYQNIKQGVFLERPNRFIAICMVGKETVTAHVKNTGRCKELLVPGVTVWLEYSMNTARKTPCDLVAVEKNGLIINMDSQAPNKTAMEGLVSGTIGLPDFGVPDEVRSEYTYGASRFDFYVRRGEHEGFVEVKGVTLEEDGVVLFPDAPTLRGIKHIRELEGAAAKGYYSCVLFIVQLSPAKYLLPNDDTQPDFGQALRKAKKNGVRIIAYQCKVTPNSMLADTEIPVRL